MTLRKYIPLLIILIYTVVVFGPKLVSGKVPISADSLVGLYHPWRDVYKDKYPNGIPVTNFLVTDPIRQQYPWRELAIKTLFSGSIPLWNPYTFSGTVLWGNGQAAPLNPFNLVYLFSSFKFGWVTQIILQILCGGVFIYIFLSHKKLHYWAVAIGTLTWVGSGFWVSWLELNTLIQTALWLPLILYFIERLEGEGKFRLVIYTALALCFSFFSGAMQVFLYCLILELIYFVYLFAESNNKKTFFIQGLIVFILFLIVSSPQWYVIWQFSLQSARNLNLNDYQNPGWFLPFKNLIQFIIPDAFGNPATLNYFGIWNYMEFVGYIGVTALCFAVWAIKSKSKEIIFWWSIVIVSFLLMLPNFISMLPFSFKLPIFSIAQPTRLMILVDFSLAVLSAYGFDFWLKNKDKRILIICITILFIEAAFLLYSYYLGQIVSIKNTILPLIFISSTVAVFVFPKKFSFIVPPLLLLLVIFDLSRFAIKFQPFSKMEYLYPQTKIIDFLQSNSKADETRVAIMSDGVMPGNTNVPYGIQIVGGYDSLGINRYLEFVSAVERNRPDTSSPFGFNRIVVPKNLNSKLYPLLGANYILSLDDISREDVRLVFTEGKTKLYKYTRSLPRAFFIRNIRIVKDKKEAIEEMFDSGFDPRSLAVVESKNTNLFSDRNFHVSDVLSYTLKVNSVEVKTSGNDDGFLVVLDPFFTYWSVSIDGTNVEIYPTDYAFRGVYVPSGNHTVLFQYKLFKL